MCGGKRVGFNTHTPHICITRWPMFLHLEHAQCAPSTETKLSETLTISSWWNRLLIIWPLWQPIKVIVHIPIAHIPQIGFKIMGAAATISWGLEHVSYSVNICQHATDLQIESKCFFYWGTITSQTDEYNVSKPRRTLSKRSCATPKCCTLCLWCDRSSIKNISTQSEDPRCAANQGGHMTEDPSQPLGVLTFLKGRRGWTWRG